MVQEKIVGGITLDRGIRLMLAILDDGGQRPLSEIAAGLALPASTAQRMVAVMTRRGVLSRARRGCLVGGPMLAGRGNASPIDLLAQAARPVLKTLARALSLTAHLGILEDWMVTYVAKEHGRTKPLFTREDRQLEAYCSAVGKVLLAALPEHERDAYLAADTFVALTPRTITTAATLRCALANVAATGHAIDDGEVATGLYCIGVPVLGPDGTVIAALSVSGAKRRFDRFAREDLLDRLHRSAVLIAERRYPGARTSRNHSAKSSISAESSF